MIFLFHGFQKWELALLVGLLAGLLAAPAQAEEPLALSRWPVEDQTARYQVSLFPFGVGPADETALAATPQPQEPTYELRFQLLDWWSEVRESITR